MLHDDEGWARKIHGPRMLVRELFPHIEEMTAAGDPLVSFVKALLSDETKRKSLK